MKCLNWINEMGQTKQTTTTTKTYQMWNVEMLSLKSIDIGQVDFNRLLYNKFIIICVSVDWGFFFFAFHTKKLKV